MSIEAGNRRVWLLTSVVAAVAVVLQITVVPQLSTGQPTQRWWPVLLVAFVAAELVRVHLNLGGEAYAFSLGSVPLLAGLALAAPGDVLIAGVGGMVLVLLRERQPPVKLVFNAVQTWSELLLALLVWRAVLGPADPLGPRGWLAIIAAAFIANVIGTLLITAVMGLMEGRSGMAGTRPVLVGSAADAFVNGTVAVLAVVVVAADPRAGWTLLVISAVLAGAYRSYAALQRRFDSVARVADFTRHVNGSLLLTEVATEVVSQTHAQLRAAVAELTLTGDDGSSVLARRSAQGAVEIVDDSAGYAVGLQLGRLRSPLLLPRSCKQPAQRAALQASGLLDAVVVPFTAGAGATGTLLAGNRIGEVETFQPEDLQVLEALANHAAMAMRNARLVDDLRQKAADREWEARHDALTGLANRTQFEEHLAGLLATAGRGEVVATLLLGLDRFKGVKDTLGHQAGDELLAQVATRLAGAVGEDGLVACFGGDEFGIVLVSAAADGSITGTARRLLAALRRPMRVGELMLDVTGSIGVALAPEHGTDPITLIRHADVAMSAATAAGTGVEVYTPFLDRDSARRLQLGGDLRSAIERGEITVVYQPQADVASGRVLGAEALARWTHPRFGPVSPGEFIPVAERTGAILPLTMHVLRTSLEAVVAWRSAGHHLHVSVNVSPRCLMDVDFPDAVAELLRRERVHPDALVLEVTESTVMADPARTSIVLERLDALGVGLAIDDFGTGYSSLSYLRRLPVGEVKIDRFFISDVVTDEGDASIVRYTIELAHQLGLRVVAEGVEDAATWERLRAMHCDSLQGFFLSRPLPRAQFDRWVRARTLSVVPPGPAPASPAVGLRDAVRSQ